MTDEDLFCELFPEYVYNGKPLSPYFDLFMIGYGLAENRYKEQLTKATEFLKKFIHLLKDADYTFVLKNTHLVLSEAEQFLKEADNAE